MPLKPNQVEPGYAPAPHLFCQARLLELTSIAQRVGTNTDRTPSPAATADPSVGRPLTKDQHSDRSTAVFHLTIDPSGWWEIREHKGSKAGLFRTRQAAIKYAREESPDGQFVIIDDIK